jgi:hypothetical protein
MYGRRVTIKHDSHEFILEISTVVNKYCNTDDINTPRSSAVRHINPNLGNWGHI